MLISCKTCLRQKCLICTDLNNKKHTLNYIFVTIIFLLVSFSVHKHLKEKDEKFQMVLDKFVEKSAEVGRLKAIIKNWEKKANEGEEKK